MNRTDGSLRVVPHLPESDLQAHSQRKSLDAKLRCPHNRENHPPDGNEMSKNMDYEDTYSTPEFGNVRYPSTAKKAINGWAYVYSKDSAYVFGLSQHHDVQVREGDRWIKYDGHLPETEDLIGQEPPPYLGEDDSDPNY